jgi:hypothetical protein
MYDRLIDSSSILGLQEGKHDPMVPMLGQLGKDTLRGEILQSSSRELYFIDEGESVGAISPVLFVAFVAKSGNFPSYSSKDLLTKSRTNSKSLFCVASGWRRFCSDGKRPWRKHGPKAGMMIPLAMFNLFRFL